MGVLGFFSSSQYVNGYQRTDGCFTKTNPQWSGKNVNSAYQDKLKTSATSGHVAFSNERETLKARMQLKIIEWHLPFADKSLVPAETKDCERLVKSAQKRLGKLIAGKHLESLKMLA